MTSEVSLIVGGKIHKGWDSASITLSAERVAGSFSLSLADAWREGDQVIQRTVKGGDACVVQVGGETVITGYVDSVAPGYSTSKHGITVSGRDVTGDLVDCSSEHLEFTGQGIAAIVQGLCKPFGVGVITKGDMGSPFPRFATNVGDGVIESIERACRLRGLIAYSDGLGNLVISKGLSGAVIERFERGKNVIEAGATHDFANRFSSITVKTSREGSDTLSTAEIASVSGVARDGAIKRHRPLIILSEMQADGLSASERADFENRMRIARSQKINLTAQGWQAPSGKVRRPGQGVQFDDDWLGASGAYVISEITLEKALSGGTTSKLTLMAPGAFDKIAEPDKGGSW
ncbi:MAG: hypothetical protein HQL45_14340 [Alphaproteobacteria bacterium]|nr:hypothetical protein [Alphaproteobacteria bacterium]